MTKEAKRILNFLENDEIGQRVLAEMLKNEENRYKIDVGIATSKHLKAIRKLVANA